MLKNMIQQERPQLLFLEETKCNNSALGNILSKAWLGCHSIAVDAYGFLRGLDIIWEMQMISLIDYHASHNLI